MIIDLLTAFITQKQETEEALIEVSEEAYKAKITDNTNDCEVKVQLLKVEDDEFCVDFTKKRGQFIDFLNLFKGFKDFIREH